MIEFKSRAEGTENGKPATDHWKNSLTLPQTIHIMPHYVVDAGRRLSKACAN